MKAIIRSLYLGPATVSGGSARFNLSDGLGSGRGEILQGGFYGAWRFDNYYLSASLAAHYRGATTGMVVGRSDGQGGWEAGRQAARSGSVVRVAG